MKFLCVSCDEPMKLQTVENGGGGSLSVVYGCPTCDHRIAMLTNPLETEMVQSLGVKIGPGEKAAAAAGSENAPAAGGGGDSAASEGEAAGGGCPFSGMVAQMEQEGSSDGPRWTAEALSRLENIPDFVRPMARQGIEHYARTEGLAEIDEEVLERARGRFGM
ncbi:MAG: PCP reductase family protein [Acidobacteriota bacterium]|jgi:hypothetical protein